MGPSAGVPELRPCRLLRQLAPPARPGPLATDLTLVDLDGERQPDAEVHGTEGHAQAGPAQLVDPAQLDPGGAGLVTPPEGHGDGLAGLRPGRRLGHV